MVRNRSINDFKVFLGTLKKETEAILVSWELGGVGIEVQNALLTFWLCPYYSLDKDPARMCLGHFHERNPRNSMREPKFC